MNAYTPFSLTIRGQQRLFTEPAVTGILNATPDSFFEGSRNQTEADIATRANEIISQGGTIIDVGACSTRPGGDIVDEVEERRRLRMALAIVRREQPEAILSIDTFRADVARMATEEFGADIINDVSEGNAAYKGMRACYILMSARSTMPETMAMVREKLLTLRAMGIDDIILDPGYGFGKSLGQNYDVLRQQEQLKEFGLPILAGVSRKRMVWQLLGLSPAEALNGTTVLNTMTLLHGADILRVHDVREAVETIKIIKECL